MKKPPSGNTGQTINLAELIDDMPEEVLITSGQDRTLSELNHA